ncbi:MAG: glutamine amidotransferase [Armatimonadota bacterium]|nr:glutamine amidotransferase [Armatimonadota bacterium]
MKHAIAIRHLAFEDLGTLGPILEERGYHVNYLEAGVDALDTFDACQPDLLIALGGPIGAYEEATYPFLSDELTILKRRLQGDLPTLGICLGAQLMARALGGRVYPGPCKEIAWATLELTEAGRQGPLAPVAGGVRVLHWHGDTFDLPEGAVRLASTPLYRNQAFSYGSRGLAFQFHIEVTAHPFERWLIGHACEINTTPGVSVEALREAAAVYSSALESASRVVWENWLDGVE